MTTNRPIALGTIALGLGLAVTTPAIAAPAAEGTISDSGVVRISDGSKGPREAELSGITAAGGETLVVNDKTDNKDVASAVLRVPGGVADTAGTEPLTQLPDLNVDKLEGITTTPDGSTVLAVSAFDRPTASFNVLMSWPADKPADAAVVGGDATTSGDLRAGISKALGNPGFFKIEGIAADDSRLYLGVREIGPDYKQAKYTVTILTVSYEVRADGSVALGNDVTKAWDMAAHQSEQMAGLPKGPIGLSDLTYDAQSQSLLLTTSFENAASKAPDSVAGYLWRVDRAALADGGKAELVTTGGKALMFTHKAEGVLSEGNRILVMHDDDSRATTVHTQGKDRVRATGEAPFDRVTLR